tara:strand:- start:180 stop:587 length:408 start_codon:yes stop_codon:yes gene_type:complete
MLGKLLGKNISTPLDFRGDGIKTNRMLGLTLFIGSIILLFTGGLSFGLYIGVFFIAVIYSAYKYINYLPIIPSAEAIILVMIIMGIIFAYFMYRIFKYFFTYLIYIIRKIINIEYFAWGKYIFKWWLWLFKRIFF